MVSSDSREPRKEQATSLNEEACALIRAKVSHGSQGVVSEEGPSKALKREQALTPAKIHNESLLKDVRAHQTHSNTAN